MVGQVIKQLIDVNPSAMQIQKQTPPDATCAGLTAWAAWGGLGRERGVWATRASWRAGVAWEGRGLAAGAQRV